MLEWVAISSSPSFRPKDRTHISYVSCIADRFFTTELPGKPTVKPDNGMNEYSDTAPGFQFVEGISWCHSMRLGISGSIKATQVQVTPAWVPRSSLCREAHVGGNHSQTAPWVLPKGKPLTQLQSKCPGGWESLLLRQDPSLGWQRCTHWPRCPGWRFCVPLTPKGHSRVQGQTHGTESLGLAPAASEGRQSCPFYTAYDVSSHTHCRLQESEIPLLISGRANR